MSSPLMQGVLSGLRANAEAFSDPDDDFEPVLFVEVDGGMKILGVGSFFENETKKELFAEFVLPALIKKMKPERVIILLSAWAVSMEKGEITEDLELAEGVPMPREHPDRVEMVLVTEVTHAGIEEVVTAYIGRDPFGVNPPELSEFDHKTFSEASRFEGRFIDPIIQTMKENHDV